VEHTSVMEQAKQNENGVITSTEFSSLTAEIRLLDEKLAEQNKKEEMLCNKLDQIVKNHEMELDLRVERWNQQFEKMQDLADAHHKQFVKECAILQQLQAGISAKNDSLTLLQYKLDEANKQLAESCDENRKLHTELFNCRRELQTTRELASSTQLRQSKELNASEEIIAMIARLKEDTAAMAGNIKTHDSVTVCSSSKDADATGQLNALCDKGSGLPGRTTLFV